MYKHIVWVLVIIIGTHLGACDNYDPIWKEKSNTAKPYGR